MPTPGRTLHPTSNLILMTVGISGLMACHRASTIRTPRGWSPGRQEPGHSCRFRGASSLIKAITLDSGISRSLKLSGGSAVEKPEPSTPTSPGASQAGKPPSTNISSTNFLNRERLMGIHMMPIPYSGPPKTFRHASRITRMGPSGPKTEVGGGTARSLQPSPRSTMRGACSNTASSTGWSTPAA